MKASVISIATVITIMIGLSAINFHLSRYQVAWGIVTLSIFSLAAAYAYYSEDER